MINTRPALDASTSKPRPAGTEFPKVLYHLKKAAKTVFDATAEAEHKLLGYTTTPPAPKVEKE
jgi:hypothetical protein